MLNINFKGKKEVLYNLNKAAQAANKYEIDSARKSCPNAQNYIEPNIAKAKMEAYIDSAVIDDSFKKTIESIQNEDTTILKKMLKTDIEFIFFKYAAFEKNINPLKIFLKELNAKMVQHDKNIKNINKIFKSIVEISK